MLGLFECRLRLRGKFETLNERRAEETKKQCKKNSTMKTMESVSSEISYLLAIMEEKVPTTKITNKLVSKVQLKYYNLKQFRLKGLLISPNMFRIMISCT